MNTRYVVMPPCFVYAVVMNSIIVNLPTTQNTVVDILYPIVPTDLSTPTLFERALFEDVMLTVRKADFEIIT